MSVEPGCISLLRLLITHSQRHPSMPCAPFNVSWIATCMNETNMDAAGYELLKIATRVASSLGVLLFGSASLLLRQTGHSHGLLPVAQDGDDAWIRGCLEDSDEEAQGIHALDRRASSHET